MDSSVFPLVLFLIGALAGALANRLPLSNVAAFLACLLPVAGFGLAMVFC
jgi:hypothetical protein